MKKIDGKMQKVVVPIAGAKPNSTSSQDNYQPGSMIKSLAGQDSSGKKGNIKKGSAGKSSA